MLSFLVAFKKNMNALDVLFNAIYQPQPPQPTRPPTLLIVITLLREKAEMIGSIPCCLMQ